MSGDIYWKIRMNPKAKDQVHAAILSGITEVFETDIKLEAVKESPYLTGTNRRSIDTEVTQDEKGVVTATIFTQSGYGGYLELGTRKMSAQPYLWPAFNKFVGKISEIVGQKIKKIKI